MSAGSLPQTIPPQTASLGKADAQGNVTIDVTWYLLLYNIANQVLNPGSGSVTGSSIDLLLIDGDDIAEIPDAPASVLAVDPTESDVSGADIARLRSMLQAAQVLLADISDPVPVGISALIDAALGDTQGDILYRDVSSWKALAPGTAGWFLKTAGAGANPSWAAGNAGDVVGPGSATDGDIVLFDGATGKLIKDSNIAYAQSTWTPTDGSGAGLTFTGVTATYTKIGRMVHIYAALTYPATVNATAMKIAGLPFTPAGNEVGGVSDNGGLSLGCKANGGAATLQFYVLATNAIPTNAQMTGAACQFSMTFQT